MITLYFVAMFDYILGRIHFLRHDKEKSNFVFHPVVKSWPKTIVHPRTVCSSQDSWNECGQRWKCVCVYGYKCVNIVVFLSVNTTFVN